MTTTTPCTEPDLSGFLAAHRAMRVEYGRLAAVTAQPRDYRHSVLIDDHIAVHLGLLNKHHRLEDSELWPMLRARAPACAAELNALEEQHSEIDSLIDIAGDRTLARKRRAAALAKLHVAINAHLDDEERLALPLIRAHISPAEWADLGRRAITAMSSRQRRVALGAGAVDAAPDELADLMATIPPAARLVVRLVWMPAARHRQRQLYGSPTTG